MDVKLEGTNRDLEEGMYLLCGQKFEVLKILALQKVNILFVCFFLSLCHFFFQQSADA